MDDDIQVSGITKYMYCPFQYLITYVLGIDDTNTYIIAGNIAHQNVDKYHKDIKPNGTIEYARLAIHSEQYHLYGYCDLVAFIPDNQGTFIQELQGRYRIVPIEYKVKYHEDKDSLYRYQCILQALCLEEMYHTTIAQTCVYYADINKRIYKNIEESERRYVTNTLDDMRSFHMHGKNQTDKISEKCNGCAKYYLCFPPKKSIESKSSSKQINKYFANRIESIRGEI